MIQESDSTRAGPREAGGAGRDVVPSPPRSPAARGAAPMQPQRDRDGTLSQIIETLLDKGLVINADITVSLAGVELLGVRIRAALASFETAARYGLDFPSGTNRDTAAWNDSLERKDSCPQCGKRAPAEQLLHKFCPWCGWRSALALSESDGHGQQSDPDSRDRAQKGGRGRPDETEAGE